MSQLSTELLEKLILSKDKKSVLRDLTPQSEEAVFTELFIDLQEGKTGPEIDKRVHEFVSSNRFSKRNSDKIWWMSFFKRLEKKEEPEKVLQDFAKFTNTKFEHLKPERLHLEREDLMADSQGKISSEVSKEFAKSVSASGLFDRFCTERDFNLLNSVNEVFFDQFDLGRFNEENDLEFLQQLMNKFPNLSHTRGAEECFLKLVKGQIYSDQIWQKFGLNQKESLMKQEIVLNHHTFFVEFLNQKFPLDEATGPLDAKRPFEEGVAALKRRIAFLEAAPKKFAGHLAATLRKLLELNLSRGIFDEEPFLKFVETPSAGLQNLSDQAAKATRQFVEEQRGNFGGGGVASCEPSLVEKYLLRFLRTEADVTRFAKFFNVSYLNEIFVRAQLFAGEAAPRAFAVLGEAALKTINAERKIDISTNDPRLTPGQPIKISAIIKNVAELRVKVFEVNTLNYLLDKKTQNFESIEVEGLVPLQETSHRYSQMPIEIHQEIFDFPDLASRTRGVFIVQFIGEDQVAKAVLRLGGLRLVFDGVNGRTCRVVDENGKVCLGKGTGIYIEGKFFEADSSGVISLSSKLKSFSEEVVITSEGFADLSILTLKNDQFSLQSNYLFNPEEFLPGNKISLALTCSLLNNGVRVSLAQLSSATLKVQATSQAGVTSNVSVKKIQLSDDRDLPVSFTMPLKCSNIEITISGTVKLGKDSIDVSSKAFFNIAQNNASVIGNVILKKDEDQNYFLQVVGLNGEDKKGKTVSVFFHQEFTSEPFSLSLVTDQFGKVYLHSLTETKRLTVDVEDTHFEFEIDNFSSKICGNRICLVGEKLCFAKKSADRVLAIQRDLNNKLVKVLDTQLKISETEVEFTIEERGFFEITIGSNNYKILGIEGKRVHLGQDLVQTSGYLLSSDPKYSDLIVALKKSDTKFEGSVTGAKGSVRAYLVTHNWYPSAFQHLEIKAGDVEMPRDMSKVDLLFKDSTFGNQKPIGEELMYVHERKSKKNFMGNTLEKPGTILRRQRVGDTAEGGKNEKAIQVLSDSSQIQPRSGCCIERLVESPSRSFEVRPANFLSKSGGISNLEVKDGRFVVEEALFKEFASSFVLVHDGFTSRVIELRSKDEDLRTENIALAESKNPNHVYSYDRKIDFVKAGEAREFKNLQNTEVSTITNISGLWDTVMLICRSSAELKEWKFLPVWEELSPLEKLKNFDKFCSHELNIFLFFKDREFFSEVVQPFLRNKRNKTVIDLFLLGDSQGLSAFADVSELNKLNVIEATFLCLGLRESNPNFAKSVRALLKAKGQIGKSTQESQRAVFDSILASQGRGDTGEDEAKDGQGAGGAAEEGAMRNDDPFQNDNMQLEDDEEEEHSENENVRQYFGGGVRRARGLVQRGEQLDMIGDFSMQQNMSQNAVFSNSIPVFGYGGRVRPAAYNVQVNDLRDVPTYGAEMKTTEYREREFFFQDSVRDYGEFWSDFCEHMELMKGAPEKFCSPGFVDACATPGQAVVALGLVDLRFRAAEPRSERRGDSLELRPCENALVFSKEIIDRPGDKLDLDVLVGQRLFDPADRYLAGGDEESQAEKPVDEFVAGKIYGSRVVVTNSTTSQQKLELVYQIPQGSIPLGTPDSLKLSQLDITSFQTEVAEFLFYFPRPGKFSLFPATVVKQGKIVASSSVPRLLVVGETLASKKTDTLVDILSTGDFDDILNFIREKNILNPQIFQFSQIYWLLKNKDFYSRLLQALREKGVFDEVAWSYSLLHGDLDGFREYLQAFKTRELNCFGYLKNKFVLKDSFDFREFFPLINPRAHASAGSRQNILNRSFRDVYDRFLRYLVDKWELTPSDKVSLVNYLLLQDRMDEATELFSSIGAKERESVDMQLQLDYLAAYIDFLNGYPKFAVAKEIAERYLTYPVLRWRNLFVEIANQLAEFEEREAIAQPGAEKLESNQEKSKRSANFSIELEADKLTIASQNIKQFRISLYKTDVEALFSSNPFSKATESSSLTFTQPFFSTTVDAEGKVQETKSFFSIPPEVNKETLFIEVNHSEEGAGKSKFVHYLPFTLSHSINQEFGIIKLVSINDRRPIPKIYIKCFAKMKNNSVCFYKDGYTDIRGSFDYAALNKDKIDDVKTFAILIHSPEFGSKTLEVEPPVKIGKTEGELVQLENKAFQAQREINKISGKTKGYTAVY